MSKIDEVLLTYLEDLQVDRAAERARQQEERILAMAIAQKRTPFPFFRKVNPVLEVRVTVSEPLDFLC